MSRILLALLLIVIQTIPAYSASFDCKKAKTAVEKMICSDESLSKLDEELAKVYAQALTAVPDRNTLKKEQREWVKNKRNTCNDTNCLLISYKNRITKLEANIDFNIRNTSQYISDKEIWGVWEELKESADGTYDIVISKSKLSYDLCKTMFKLIKQHDHQYTYAAIAANNCYAMSRKKALNYIIITPIPNEFNDWIRVKYYYDIKEDGWLGEETFFRIDR